MKTENSSLVSEFPLNACEILFQLNLPEDEGEGLGFRLTRTLWDPYPWVREVTPNGRADQAGLKPGDCILQADGKDLLGLPVREVTPNGRADQAGLKPGDCILQADGKDLLGLPVGQVAGLIRGDGAGGAVMLLVWNCGVDPKDDPELLWSCGGGVRGERARRALAGVVRALACCVCAATAGSPLTCARSHVYCELYPPAAVELRRRAGVVRALACCVCAATAGSPLTCARSHVYCEREYSASLSISPSCCGAAAAGGRGARAGVLRYIPQLLWSCGGGRAWCARWRAACAPPPPAARSPVPGRMSTASVSTLHLSVYPPAAVELRRRAGVVRALACCVCAATAGSPLTCARSHVYCELYPPAAVELRRRAGVVRALACCVCAATAGSPLTCARSHVYCEREYSASLSISPSCCGAAAAGGRGARAGVLRYIPQLLWSCGGGRAWCARWRAACAPPPPAARSPVPGRMSTASVSTLHLSVYPPAAVELRRRAGVVRALACCVCAATAGSPLTCARSHVYCEREYSASLSISPSCCGAAAAGGRGARAGVLRYIPQLLWSCGGGRAWCARWRAACAPPPPAARSPVPGRMSTASVSTLHLSVYPPAAVELRRRAGVVRALACCVCAATAGSPLTCARSHVYCEREYSASLSISPSCCGAAAAGGRGARAGVLRYIPQLLWSCGGGRAWCARWRAACAPPPPAARSPVPGRMSTASVSTLHLSVYPPAAVELRRRAGVVRALACCVCAATAGSPLTCARSHVYCEREYSASLSISPSCCGAAAAGGRGARAGVLRYIPQLLWSCGGGRAWCARWRAACAPPPPAARSPVPGRMSTASVSTLHLSVYPPAAVELRRRAGVVRALACCVCAATAGSPLTCARSHVYCEPCWTRLERCALCREALPSKNSPYARNLVAEQVFEAIATEYEIKNPRTKRPTHTASAYTSPARTPCVSPSPNRRGQYQHSMMNRYKKTVHFPEKYGQYASDPNIHRSTTSTRLVENSQAGNSGNLTVNHSCQCQSDVSVPKINVENVDDGNKSNNGSDCSSSCQSLTLTHKLVARLRHACSLADLQNAGQCSLSKSMNNLGDEWLVIII
uniref:PDZ domain-containing protein n=1 Tax=Heliothis virescens TaxID=7102 RepID=A0A2A4ITJ7_HELVI